MDAINDATLGARLQGAQHFGLTVQNMDRAFEFYTEVLGGAEIMRDGDFHGGPIHNTILADQEIIAHQLKVDPRTIGVPDLKDGAQRLDVRFVQFDNFGIELLQYREADQPMGSGDSWAEPRDHMSPAYPRSMHICFHLRDDVDFAKFVTDLEAECARRGMSQVKANRTVAITTEDQRKAAPVSAKANKITQGKSNGWALIYCKGQKASSSNLFGRSIRSRRHLRKRSSAALKQLATGRAPLLVGPKLRRAVPAMAIAVAGNWR